ncbi:cysteine-rich CWC family protein [Amphritea atlantica]|uniref:cysteine-rich CWC family protein n=1 Tax=Amphritea atlantica TaxID=355243 RepID=UPI001C312074
MNTNPDRIDPTVCPLCHQDNGCGGISSSVAEPDCWCRSPDIAFPEALLALVPEEAKGKACICKSCASKIVK